MNSRQYSGIWKSRYGYHSSGQAKDLASEHFVRLTQTGDQLVVESLPDLSRSSLLLQLALDDQIATGTWREQTDPLGYYQGTVYHGAIQLIIAKDNKHMSGKWVGKNGEVNVGPWELSYVGDRPQDATNTATDTAK